jgi:DNA polymerase III subunit gamma/tau
VALALYRKYRPRTFAEVIGQEHVTVPLMQALRSGRLNHAYLFSGPRGCGKTSSARILARSLNCEKGPTPEPCGVCDSCVALAPDGSGSLDVIEIDAASHGGVDDARDLRERAFFAPVASRFKVYIIDEAHMISSQGFNALLKLVEEPPDYIKFVFATTEPEKVLGTIRSRTHHYPFRLIPPGVLRPYLEHLCELEGVKVDSAVFPLVVRAGGGSARDSESVLDQLISGAGPDGVTYAQAVSLLGVTDVALIDEMCDALAAGDGAAVFATIDRVAEAGHDARRFAGDLLERLRDLIIFQQVPDAATKGLLDAPADELSRMEAQAERFGPASLSRMADIVHTGLTEMRGTTAPRLLLELISARMLLPGADDSSAALLHRLERMERRLTATSDTPALPPAGSPPPPPASTPRASAAPAAPAASAAPATPAASPAPATPAASRPDTGRPPASPSPGPTRPVAEVPEPAGDRPAADRALAGDRAPSDGGSGPVRRDAPAGPSGQSAAQPAPGAVDAQAVRRVWEEILGYLRRRSQRAAAVVREAVVRDVEGDTLVLTFKHQFHAESLSNSPELLEEAVHEVLGGRWRIRAEWAGGPIASQAPAGPAPSGRAGAAASGSARRSAPEPRSAAPAPAAPRSSGRRGTDRSAGDATEEGSPAARASGARPATSAGADEEDWPVTAQPGGAASAADASGGPEGGDPATPAGPGRGSPAGAGSPPNWADPAQAADAGSSRAAPGAGGANGTGVSGGPGAAYANPGSQPLAGQGMSDQGAARPGAAARAAARQAASGPRASSQAASGPGGSGPGGSGSGASGQGASGQGASGRGAPGRGAAGARAGSGRPGASRGASGRGAAGAAGDTAWREAPPADEPPFDPDYDRPVADHYDGFDPGDEPLDDEAGGLVTRESSEEQALRLLRETLGAERID